MNVATKLGVTTSHDLGTGVHIRSADSSASVSGDADELVIEGSGNAGLSILTGTSALGSIYFGDSGDNDIGGFYYDHSGNALNIRSNGSDRMRLDSSGALNFGDDLQNGSLTIGININQGSNDNEIIALKSTDIAHGLTSVAETDTYGSLKKNDGGIRGGLAIYGMAESDYTGAGVELHAYSQGSIPLLAPPQQPSLVFVQAKLVELVALRCLVMQMLFRLLLQATLSGFVMRKETPNIMAAMGRGHLTITTTWNC